MRKQQKMPWYHKIVTPEPKYDVTLCLDWPYIERLNLLEVEAWMLFPSGRNAQQNRSAYEALGIRELLTLLLEASIVPVAEAFRGTLSYLVYRYCGDRDFLYTTQNIDKPKHRVVISTAWMTYQMHLQNASFPRRGKGSILERYMRGSLAGYLLSIAFLNGLSIEQAAIRLCSDFSSRKSRYDNSMQQVIHELYPTLTVQNLTQNIWPEFRFVAHLYTALHDFSGGIFDHPTVGTMLSLDEIQEIENPGWPTRWEGWRNLLHKANYILHTCVEQGSRTKSTKSLLTYEDSVRWMLPLEK